MLAYLQIAAAKRFKKSGVIIQELFELIEVEKLEAISSKKKEYSALVEKAIMDLRDTGYDINPQDENTGLTLLHLIIKGLLDQRLLEYFSASNIKESPESLLVTAIKSKNLHGIQWILDQGVDINERDKSGQTALDKVIVVGDPDHDVIKFLVNKGADANGLIIIKKLFEYVRRNEIKSISTNKKEYSIILEKYIKGLLEKGGDINHQDGHKGITLLHLIVGDLLDQRLLKYFSASNIKESPESLLVTAIKSKNLHGIQWLLDKGVDINERDKSGQTTLDKVIAVGNPDHDVIKFLVNKGKDANGLIIIKKLFEYVRRNEIKSISTNKKEYSIILEKYIKGLLEKGGDINPQDENTGLTLLHLIIKGLLDQRLLKYFSASNIKESPEPLLVTAVKAKNLHGVQWLLDRGVDINEQDQDGCTALYWAATDTRPNKNLVGFLLDNDADAETVDVVRIISKHILSELQLIYANKKLHSMLVEKQFEALLNRGGDINEYNNSTDILAYIFAGGLDQGLLDYFNAFDKNKIPHEYLIEAILSKNLYCIKWLLDKGVDINKPNEHGELALEAAVTTERPDTDLVKFLLDKGADVNYELFETSLMMKYRTKNTNFQVALLLLSKFKNGDVNFKQHILDFLALKIDEDEEEEGEITLEYLSKERDNLDLPTYMKVLQVITRGDHIKISEIVKPIDYDDIDKILDPTDYTNIDKILDQTEDKTLKFIALQNLYHMLRKFNLSNENARAKKIEEYVSMKLSVMLRSFKTPITDAMDVDSQLEDICMDFGSNVQINSTNEFNKRSRIDTDETKGASTPTLDHDMDLIGIDLFGDGVE